MRCCTLAPQQPLQREPLAAVIPRGDRRGRRQQLVVARTCRLLLHRRLRQIGDGGRIAGAGQGLAPQARRGWDPVAVAAAAGRCQGRLGGIRQRRQRLGNRSVEVLRPGVALADGAPGQLPGEVQQQRRRCPRRRAARVRSSVCSSAMSSSALFARRGSSRAASCACPQALSSPAASATRRGSALADAQPRTKAPMAASGSSMRPSQAWLPKRQVAYAGCCISVLRGASRAGIAAAAGQHADAIGGAGQAQLVRPGESASFEPPMRRRAVTNGSKPLRSIRVMPWICGGLAGWACR